MWRQKLGPYPSSPAAKDRWWNKAAQLNWRKVSRKDILSFLQWNDPNGRYTDKASREEGLEPLTKEEALEYLQGVLAEGASSGSVSQNPQPKAGRQGMLLGKIQSIEVEIGDEVATITPKAQYLGCLNKGKTLCVLHKSKRKDRPTKLNASVEALHRQFHNSDPTRLTYWEWPDPKGKLTNVGLIQALTYSIPSWLRSPDKKKYLWHHEFGDHGERGHGPVRGSGHYPDTYKPLLQIDEAGNLFIKRRKGNKFYVTDWLYW